MGLFSRLLGADPEKLERRGDTYLSGENWGAAKVEYEKALDALGGRGDDAAAERLREKIGRARESLAREHLRTGAGLADRGFREDALELFRLARELTRDPRLAEDLEGRLAGLAADGGEGAPEGEDPVEEPREADNPDDLFEALCGSLPEPVRQAYASYGATFQSGYLALNRGDFQQAVEELSRAREQNPSPRSLVPLELANALVNVGRLDEARDLLRTFLGHHPDALPGYRLLCEVLWETGDPPGAEALVLGCPDTLKSSLAYHLLRGETIVRCGRTDEAVAFYGDFLQRYGWQEPAARALAELYRQTGRAADARELYAGILERCRGCHQRQDPEVKRRLADIDFDMQRHDVATLERYLALAREDPADRPYYFDRVSRIYASMGNEKEAERFRHFARQAGGG